MKRIALLILVGLVGCTEGQTPDHVGVTGAFGGEPFGIWKLHHSEEGGISAAFPCNPLISNSDPQDGYGHQTQQFELRCLKPLGEMGNAFFRVTKTTYPVGQGLARYNYDKYLAYVHSDHVVGPKVQIVGQERETHSNYVLKNHGVNGDLGVIETHDSCMWNFMGLDGESRVQALVTLPKRMCHTGAEPIVPEAVGKFFDSIALEAR